MLRVSLVGNLGQDPEVRYTAKGTQVVSLNVAVNQVRFGADGNREESTEWFRISVYGKPGEYAQSLTKGSRVLVFGRLTIGHYTAKNDGSARVSFDVTADELQTIKRGGEQTSDNNSDNEKPVVSSAPKAAVKEEPVDLEDLPF